MKTKLHLFLVILLLNLNAESQTTFQKKYSPGYTSDIRIDTLSDGYLLVGSTFALTSGGVDGFAMKIDLSGNVQWSSSYGGNGSDRFLCMQRTHDGNFVLAGITQSFVGSPSDSGNIYLVKINPIGVVLWSKSIGTSGRDCAFCIKETNDLGLVIVGSSDSLNYSRVYMIKTDSAGSIQWNHLYKDSYFPVSIARGVVQTIGGGYALTGYSSLANTSTDSTWMFIMRTDNTGNIIASTHYLDNHTLLVHNGVYGYDIIENSVRHLVAVGGDGGYFFSPGITSYSPILLEVDTDNLQAPLEIKMFNLNTGDSRAISVQQSPDNGYILGGYMGNYFPMMLKTNPVYTTEWCFHYDSSYTNIGYGYSAKQTSDGGFILSANEISGNRFHVVKTNVTGNSGCDEAIPISAGQSVDYSLSMVQRQWTGFTDAGQVSANTNRGIVSSTSNTLCSTAGIFELNTDESMHIYPNPSSGNFKIITNENINHGIIEVYNSLGEKIFHDQINFNRENEINLTKISAGIYFVKLTDGERQITGKLIIGND